MAKRYKKEKSSNKIKIISIFIWVLFAIINLYLIGNIIKTDMIPTKYLIIGISAIAILILVILVIIGLKKKGMIIFICLNIFMILVSCTEIYVGTKLNTLTEFLNNQLEAKYMTNVYNVIVNVDSNYNSLEDIANKDIYYLKEDNDQLVINNINKNIEDVKIIEVDDITDIFKNLQKDKKYISIMNSGNYDAIISNDEDIEKSVKVIGSFEIKTEIKTESNNIDVTKEPFVIFVNGIDTRSGKLPAKSLSDVNIIMAVNPRTNHILMIHVPRDYYVEVSGKNGAKDKLTHTGSIGGVDLTMKTLEELFEMDIQYYVRTNFNAVINLVDAIGGIDVYSDVDYSFHSYNLPALVIKPGYNHLNGEEALAFAKERHAYKDGDRHRGENQEQVIKCVINKMTSSKTMLTNFDNIFKSVSGTFETNFALENVSALVKMQISEMPKWLIEECNVTGTGSEEYTFSYPKQKLYVMKPDMASIENAINKLNEVLEEN